MFRLPIWLLGAKRSNDGLSNHLHANTINALFIFSVSFRSEGAIWARLQPGNTGERTMLGPDGGASVQTMQRAQLLGGHAI